MSNKVILAIETATSRSSVCLAMDGAFSHAPLDAPETQAASLVPAIENLLSSKGIWYSDLTHLIATIGPGSFTGIRIGLSVARTIAFANPNLIVKPITTLECLAAGFQGGTSSFHATLRAGKGEIYHQIFSANSHLLKATSEIAIVKPDFFLDLSAEEVVIGNTHELMPQQVRFQFATPENPEASNLMNALERIAHQGQHDLRPLYIRAPDAKLPTKPYV